MNIPPNPFRPGAGHPPPYLAGRDTEQKEFAALLLQKPVLQNVVITGLRGIGKTVLMESLKPLAGRNKWAWVGTDLSESASISEAAFAERLLTDLSVFGSALKIPAKKARPIGFNAPGAAGEAALNYPTLRAIFDSTPGLISDKLRAVVELVGMVAQAAGAAGIIFAYDEAQTMFDDPEEKQYPLALLLDVFQSVQRKGVQVMLLLTGLPTLFPKLVQARTFAERMFRVIELRPLPEQEAEKAIREPFRKGVPAECHFSDQVVRLIVGTSAGYPYFIQFIGKEVFDVLGAQPEKIKFVVPINEIVKKLDQEFFSGRWARVTDRQRDLIKIIAQLPTANDEFTVQEISEKSRDPKNNVKPFKPSQIVQMLAVLTERGLVYKDRHGKYFFAVPLFADFVKRLRD